MSLETTIARDREIRRASLRGCGSELVKLGIPREKVTQYHYFAVEFYCKVPHAKIEDDINLYHLELGTKRVLAGVDTLEDYKIGYEADRMGDL